MAQDITGFGRLALSARMGALALCLLACPALAQLETKVNPNLPSLGDNDPGSEDSKIICRPPQKQSDSRLLGPEVCKPKKVWDDLHAQGLDISADGKGVVASEKYRSLNPHTCGTNSGCGL